MPWWRPRGMSGYAQNKSYLIQIPVLYERATQDPPQQVIDDCTKEVDEALRQAQKKNLLYKTRHSATFLLYIYIESSVKAVFSSIWPLDNLISVDVFSPGLGQPWKSRNWEILSIITYILCVRIPSHKFGLLHIYISKQEFDILVKIKHGIFAVP